MLKLKAKIEIIGYGDERCNCFHWEIDVTGEHVIQSDLWDVKDDSGYFSSQTLAEWREEIAAKTHGLPFVVHTGSNDPFKWKIVSK